MDRTRRGWLISSGGSATGAVATPIGGLGRTACPAGGGLFLERDVCPRPRLVVGKTLGPTPRFPVTDVVTCSSFNGGVSLSDTIVRKVCRENGVRLAGLSL